MVFVEGSFLIALDKYRDGLIQDANSRFRAIVDICPEHWEARLYLAMTSIQLGDRKQGLTQMTHLKEFCPDPVLKQKAEVGLKSIPPLDEDDLEVVWKRGQAKKPRPNKCKPRMVFFFWQR